MKKFAGDRLMEDLIAPINRPGLGIVDLMRGERGEPSGNDTDGGTGFAKIKRKHKGFPVEEIIRIILRGQIYTTHDGNRRDAPVNGKAVILGDVVVFLSPKSNGHYQVDSIYRGRSKCNKVIEASR